MVRSQDQFMKSFFVANDSSLDSSFNTPAICADYRAARREKFLLRAFHAPNSLRRVYSSHLYAFSCRSTLFSLFLCVSRGFPQLLCSSVATKKHIYFACSGAQFLCEYFLFTTTCRILRRSLEIWYTSVNRFMLWGYGR